MAWDCRCCGKHFDYEHIEGSLKVCLGCWEDRDYQKMLRIEPGRAEEVCKHGR